MAVADISISTKRNDLCAIACTYIYKRLMQLYKSDPKTQSGNVKTRIKTTHACSLNSSVHLNFEICPLAF